MSDELLTRIDEIEAQARSLEEALAEPSLASRPADYAARAKELGKLRPLVELGRRWRRARTELADARGMLEEPDEEMRALARVEVDRLEAELEKLEREIRLRLVPPDPNDEKNAILEVRAGAGGEEAALFAADLYRMYTRYAEVRGWKLEPLSLSWTGGGGLREAVASIAGERVFSRLKYERGVHRVQRVPTTESAGRIHTSTVTVAVLPEAEDVDVRIDPKELRIDVMRSSGPGGQSVNTTDSAVRITHEPSGIVVHCQDEKSQHKNKARAMKILRARLLQLEQERAAQERADERRSQVGTGDRSERIRTYNFPQSRVTDHRAGVTLHRLPEILEGNVDELLDAVHLHMAGETAPGAAQ